MLKARPKKQVQSTTGYFHDGKTLTPSERNGVWVGSACSQFGVTPRSIVIPDDLERGLLGLSLNNRVLRRLNHSAPRVAFDLSLSSTKSVSVCALCLDEPDIMRTIRDAFHHAAIATFHAIEWFARFRHKPTCQSPPDLTNDSRNAIAASFLHHASRHNDPHLHAHFLTLNTTWVQPLQQWRALDPINIIRNFKTLDAFFQRDLLANLRQHGLRAVPLNKPVPWTHIPAVPGHVADRLSKANAAITQAANQFAQLKADTPGLRELTDETWRDYLNDRTRPSKSAPPEWAALLRSSERAEILRQIRADPPPPDPPLLPDEIHALLVNAVRRGPPVLTRSSLAKSALDIARAYPSTNITAITPVMDQLWTNRNRITRPHTRALAALQKDMDERSDILRAGKAIDAALLYRRRAIARARRAELRSARLNQNTAALNPHNRDLLIPAAIPGTSSRTRV